MPGGIAMKNILTRITLTALVALIFNVNSFAATPIQPGWPIPVHDDVIYTKLYIDRLEYARSDENGMNMDAMLRIGGDYNRLVLKAEGEHTFNDAGVMSVDMVYSRIVSPYWDVQAGLAMDAVMHQQSDNKQRYSAVVGLMGLAPYWFETDFSLYVSEQGDVSGVLELEYEWLFSQRLILQARGETMAAMQSVADWGVYGGFNQLDAGLRLRYEIKREFAPYVGIEYGRALGNAARAKQDASLEPGEISFLAGVRMWF